MQPVTAAQGPRKEQRRSRQETVKTRKDAGERALTFDVGPTWATKRRNDVCSRVRGADPRDVRGVRRRSEVARTMNLANSVGLILAVAIALFLIATLLFPERF